MVCIPLQFSLTSTVGGNVGCMQPSVGWIQISNGFPSTTGTGLQGRDYGCLHSSLKLVNNKYFLRLLIVPLITSRSLNGQ